MQIYLEQVMNSLKVTFFILLVAMPFVVRAMNDTHDSSSDDVSLREMLTPRKCDQETYERFAEALSLDDLQKFMEIVLDIGMGKSVLSDVSIVKLIALADKQNNKFYADVLRDAQEILNRAYGEF